MKNKLVEIVIISISLFLLTGCNKIEPVVNDTDLKVELKELGYDDKVIKELYIKLNETEISILTEYDYVENILDLLNNKKFNQKKLKEYLDNYDITKNIEHSLIIVNSNITYTYNEKLASFLNTDYFISSRLDRYMNFTVEDNNYRYVVEMVNKNLDREKYIDSVESNVSLKNLMLVNEYYKLSPDYVPNDLVIINKKYAFNNKKIYIDSNVYDMFKKMYDVAKKDNIDLVIDNGYLSYDEINELYEKNEFEIKAGFSEYQTGLSIDIHLYDDIKDNYYDSDLYKWIKNNCYKYGFIETLSNFKEEANNSKSNCIHLRYIGVNEAEYINNNNISFDEYYSYFIENKSID